MCVCEVVGVGVCPRARLSHNFARFSPKALGVCIRIRDGIRANASALYASLLHFCVGLLNINAISLWPITLQPIRILSLILILIHILIRFRIRSASLSLLCKWNWTKGVAKGVGRAVGTGEQELLLYGLLQFLVQIVIGIDKPKVAR